MMARTSSGTMSEPAKPSNRTISIAKLGVVSILTLAGVILAALGLRIGGSELTAVCEAVSSLSLALAATATGGAVGHGARHWGARETSS